MTNDKAWSGIKIRDLRLKLGWTQNQLGEYLQVSKGLISKMERGERQITSEMMGKLSKIRKCIIS